MLRSTLAALAVVVLVLLLVVAAVLAIRRGRPRRGGAAGAPATPEKLDPFYLEKASTPVRKAVLRFARGRFAHAVDDEDGFLGALADALETTGAPRVRALERVRDRYGARPSAHRGPGWGSGTRARRKAQGILRLVKAEGLEATPPYLDFGCGDGKVTEALGAAMGDPRPVGVDVSEKPKGFPAGVEYARALDAVPGRSVNFATALMVLHHVESSTSQGGSVKKVAAGLARVLRPGGLLVVREHNVATCAGADGQRLSPRDAALYLDWMHLVYEIAEQEAVPARPERSRYRSSWEAPLAGAGFERVARARTRPNDPMCSYFAVYRRR